MATRCCLRSCQNPDQPAAVLLDIWPPSDLPAIHASAHHDCIVEVMNPTASPDPLEEHGRIPANAKCLICGGQLPVIGRHPYALDIWEEELVGRYWAHAACAESVLELDPGRIK